jgi:hypothetical protein
MPDLTSSKIKFFLEDVAFSNEAFHNIVKACRELVLKHKGVGEDVKYEGILFSKEESFGGIFVSKNHVSFEFSNGYLLTDPNNILEGNGKFRRHIKLRSISDIKTKDIENFISQALSSADKKVH